MTVDRTRAPTPRQRECFEAYARIGNQALAAQELGLSLQRLKSNLVGYYARVGARNAVQAAYITWKLRVDIDTAYKYLSDKKTP